MSTPQGKIFIENAAGEKVISCSNLPAAAISFYPSGVTELQAIFLHSNHWGIAI